ncbi:MAG: glycosyltransferase [Paracoccaceae bacterium]
MNEDHPLPCGPIAYLTGEYPRATDTFIQREVAGLRAIGIEVLTCSVRRTNPSHHVGAEQRGEYARTFQLLAAASSPLRLMTDHGVALFTRPHRYFRALWLAVRTCPPGLRDTFRQICYFAEAGVLASALRRRGVRHLHNHFANSSCTVAMLTSEVSGIPFSFTMHGPAIFFEAAKWRLDERIARASFVSCISHFCRSQGMIFAAPEHWSKMHVLRCAVDPDFYDRPLVVSGKELLFVGRLAAVKGLPVLLEAVASLCRRHPDVRLTMIGDGPERGQIEALADRLGITENVRFKGYLSQESVAAQLTRTDVFVLPSFAEGVPVVLMEAMACRVPVVATQIAGVGELVENGVSGLLVPPADLDGLIDAIESLLMDPQRRRVMGNFGRAKVVESFNTVTESKRLAALFQRSMVKMEDDGRQTRPVEEIPA